MRPRYGLSALALTGALAGGFLGGPPLAALMTSSETAVATTSTGTVRLAIAPGETASYTTSISDLRPGQTTDLYMTIENVGSLAYGRLEERVAATGTLVDAPAPTATSSQVNSDGTTSTKVGTGGTPLTLTVLSCPLPWVNGTCSSTPTTEASSLRLADAPAFPLQGGSLLAPSQATHLKLSYTLPANAGQEYQGAKASITYKVTATQRDPRVSGGRS